MDGHGVPAFSDVFLGIELAAAATGHSLSLADAAAASIFIETALNIGSGFESWSFPTGGVQDVPALQSPGFAAPDGLTTYVGSSRDLNLPGIARDATTVEALYWPHGHCEPRGEVSRLASAAGLERYRPRYHPGWDDVVKSEPRILSGFPIGASKENKELPNGWYRGSRGTTLFWREFYRIQRKQSLFTQKPETYKDHRTFLVVIGAMWHYHHAAEFWLNDDYETRVAFRVFSQPFSSGTGWAYDVDQIRKHRQAAERVATALHDYLAALPPSRTSVQFRRSMNPMLLHPSEGSDAQ